MKDLKLALQLFWHRMLSPHNDPTLLRLECEYGNHDWADIHRPLTPEYWYWVVDHQLCSRCGETRPPPENR